MDGPSSLFSSLFSGPVYWLLAAFLYTAWSGPEFIKLFSASGSLCPLCLFVVVEPFSSYLLFCQLQVFLFFFWGGDVIHLWRPFLTGVDRSKRAEKSVTSYSSIKKKHAFCFQQIGSGFLIASTNAAERMLCHFGAQTLRGLAASSPSLQSGCQVRKSKIATSLQHLELCQEGGKGKGEVEVFCLSPGHRYDSETNLCVVFTKAY